MPVTVTVSRSNPLPVPIALVLTIVGAALIVVGFAWVPPLPDFESSNIILTVLAAIFVIPAWGLYLLVVVRNLLRGDQGPELPTVPKEIEEPPSKHDAAVVSTLIGRGKPGRRAIAGTVLELAHRNALSIDEFGEKVVIQVSERAKPKDDGEKLVLDGLREYTDDSGDITGPPIWKKAVGWWGAFRRDARARAANAGLVETRIPMIGLIIVLVFTAVGVSLMFFERTLVFIGTILLANGLPHLIARGSGYRLTQDGEQLAAAWTSFGRYLYRHESFRDAGPAGVAIWGPNLAYGTVLGVAERAARPLTPGIEDEAEEQMLEITKVYEL